MTESKKSQKKVNPQIEITAALAITISIGGPPRSSVSIMPEDLSEKPDVEKIKKSVLESNEVKDIRFEVAQLVTNLREIYPYAKFCFTPLFGDSEHPGVDFKVL